MTFSTHLPLNKMAAIFAEKICKCVFLNEKFCISIWISLKFVPKGPIDNKSEALGTNFHQITFCLSGKGTRNVCKYSRDSRLLVFHLLACSSSHIPSTWWCHQIETFSTLLALCERNSLVTGEFPSQRPVTQSFDGFFDLHSKKQLNKQ